MAAGRSLKSLVSRRRRTANDVEEEEDDDHGLVVVEDSQSEGSVGSKADDEDLDASSVEDQTVHLQAQSHGSGTKRSKRPRKKGHKVDEGVGRTKTTQDLFPATTDTEMMLRGVRPALPAAIPDTFQADGANSNHSQTAAIIPSSKAKDAVVEHHHPSDQDDFRKKRDADPSFTPNRGAFFMHDTRGHQTGHFGPLGRGAWQGRGRGRGTAVGHDGHNTGSSHNNTRVEPAAEQPWKHDLHDTINAEPQQASVARPLQGRFGQVRPPQGPVAMSFQSQQRAMSFSTTKLVGTVQIRVNLPGMAIPVNFADVPWKHYTRLPNHRPPLRRDKPIRVSFPPDFQRYVFPSSERSFIFIPRQMRPNQQGYHRNAYQRSIGGYGYSSRRTSVYGGSTYSASIAGSRRSSFTGMSRPDLPSPIPMAGVMPPYNSRPTVRLPLGNQGAPTGPLSDRQTPTRPTQLHTYPLPQQPAYQGTPTTMMHQPKPQKAISVTGIESPAALHQAPLGEEMQPFQGQLPHIHDVSSYGPVLPSYYSPRQQYMYPAQAPMGTPLSGIPEQSMYAQSFHPQHMPYGQPPYFTGYPPHNYYHPGPGAPIYPPPMPAYATGHGSYASSPTVHASSGQASVPRMQSDVQLSDGAEPGSMPSQAPTGMVAHESNGMVFYLPASEAQNSSRGESYQPAEGFVPSYAMPGLPPPTPAPDSTSYYYPNVGMGGAQAPAFYPHAEPQA